MKKQYLAVLFLIIAKSTMAVEIVTEVMPPYSYVRDNNIHGVSTRLVQAIFDQANIKYSIKVTGWPTAFRRTVNNPDVFIYSLAKNQPRMKKFQYIAALVPLDACMYRLRTSKDVDIRELRDSKLYRVGVVTGSWGANLLVNKVGHSRAYTRESHYREGFIKALQGGRIDVWFSPKHTALVLAKEMGVNLVEEFCIKGDESLYLATDMKTDKSLIKKLKESYEKLKEEGGIAHIYNQFDW